MISLLLLSTILHFPVSACAVLGPECARRAWRQRRASSSTRRSCVRAAPWRSIPAEAEAEPAILQCDVAEKLPFGNLREVFAAFSIPAGSAEAANVAATLSLCQSPPRAGELKACTISLESTVQSTMDMLGTGCVWAAMDMPAAYARRRARDVAQALLSPASCGPRQQRRVSATRATSSERGGTANAASTAAASAKGTVSVGDVAREDGRRGHRREGRRPSRRRRRALCARGRRAPPSSTTPSLLRSACRSHYGKTRICRVAAALPRAL
ncbi:hypothetical protein EJB05_57857, partial [Eragrostis curvula]